VLSKRACKAEGVKAEQCSTVQYSAVQCSTVQYRAVRVPVQLRRRSVTVLPVSILSQLQRPAAWLQHHSTALQLPEAPCQCSALNITAQFKRSRQRSRPC
jgi:hypothetical protein